jgi:multidrug efflux pump subunit AcrB
VLTTALTAMFALFPIAVSASSAAQRGMAAAMIGGTFASTVLTLFVTPVLLRNVCFRRKR